MFEYSVFLQLMIHSTSQGFFEDESSQFLLLL